MKHLGGAHDKILSDRKVRNSQYIYIHTYTSDPSASHLAIDMVWIKSHLFASGGVYGRMPGGGQLGCTGCTNPNGLTGSSHIL